MLRSWHCWYRLVQYMLSSSLLALVFAKSFPCERSKSVHEVAKKGDWVQKPPTYLFVGECFWLYSPNSYLGDWEPRCIDREEQQGLCVLPAVTAAVFHTEALLPQPIQAYFQFSFLTTYWIITKKTISGSCHHVLDGLEGRVFEKLLFKCLVS